MSAEQQNSHQNLKNIYCPCQLHYDWSNIFKHQSEKLLQDISSIKFSNYQVHLVT
jgi:hypothetical protein